MPIMGSELITVSSKKLHFSWNLRCLQVWDNDSRLLGLDLGGLKLGIVKGGIWMSVQS